MRTAGQCDHCLVPGQQRFDEIQVLADRHFIALALVMLVPLIVVVEDKCDEVVKFINETVGSCRVDELMEAAVDRREILIVAVNL